MKFEVASQKILQLLQVVSRVVQPKNNLPVLDNILFVLEDNTLSLSGSDLGNRIDAVMEVNNTGGVSGSFAVSPRVLLEPIKGLPDQPIEITINPETFESEIRYQNGFYTFVAIDGSTYPVPVEQTISTEPVTLQLTAEQLVSGIGAAAYAASNDEKRPIMTGVYFDIFEDKIVFVGSDSKMLARVANNNVQTGVHQSFCMPKKSSTLLSRVLLPHEEADKMIRVNIYEDKYVVFKLEGYTLATRLLEGRYPNYNSVIPQMHTYELRVDRAALLSATKRVGVFANEGDTMVRYEIMPEGIKLSTNDFDYSVSAEELVEADCPAGINLRMGFSAAAMVAILSTMTTEEVRIQLVDQTRPALILPGEDEAGVDICNLLLPMRVLSDQ